MSKASTYTVTASGNADIDAALAAANGLVLVGFGVSETAASPAVAEVAIYHGATVTGGSALMPTFSYAANGSHIEWLGPGGVSVPNGVSIEKPSGTTVVTLYHRTDPG